MDGNTHWSELYSGIIFPNILLVTIIENINRPKSAGK